MDLVTDFAGLNRWPKSTLNKEQQVADNEAHFALSLSLSLSLPPSLASLPSQPKPKPKKSPEYKKYGVFFHKTVAVLVQKC